MSVKSKLWFVGTKVVTQQHADSPQSNWSDEEGSESVSRSMSMSDVDARLPVVLLATGNGVDKQHDVSLARQQSQDVQSASPTKRRHVEVTGTDGGKLYLQQVRELLDLERQLQAVVVKRDYVEAARIQEACHDTA